MSQIHEFLPMPHTHTPLRNKAIFKYLKVLSIINHHCHIIIPENKAGYFSWDVWGVTFQFHIKQKNPCVTYPGPTRSLGTSKTILSPHAKPPTRRTCQKPCEASKAPGPLVWLVSCHTPPLLIKRSGWHF